MHGDIWKHLGRSQPRELKCCLKEAHVDTHCLDFEAALARIGTEAERGERGTYALGSMSKPVLWLLALKNLLSKPAKGLIYDFKETIITLKNP